MVVFFLIPLAVFAVYSFLTNSLYEVELPLTLDGVSGRADVRR